MQENQSNVQDLEDFAYEQWAASLLRTKPPWTNIQTVIDHRGNYTSKSEPRGCV